MSASQLFDWPTAKAALNAGWRVRRSGWTDRWMERWTGGLIWLILSDGTKRVVQATDFGADEFTALDWTNLSPECVTAGTTAGTGTNGCPLPYTPPIIAPGTGTPDSPNTPSSPSTPVAADQPPSGAPGAGQNGSGGGGGGGSGGGNTPRRDPQNITWPTLSLSIQDSLDTCYVRGNYPTDFVNPIFNGTVSLSLPDNYNGPSVFFVSVKNGFNTVATCSIGAGGSYGFEWTDPLPVSPDSTLGFTARAWADGAPDIQSSTTAKIAPWCENGLSFDCATPEGYCHNGVGWVRVTNGDPGLTVIYEGCPQQGQLSIGAGSTLIAGATVTVRYSNSDGPCPGGHCCNYAIFSIKLWHEARWVAVGTVNLNNNTEGDDNCGDRGPFTFPITQAMLDALDTP